MLRVTALIGKPKPMSRTTRIAEEVQAQVAARLRAAGAAVAEERIELAELGAALIGWQEPAVAERLDRIAQAHLLVVASPTFKATYTGLLKIFLDQVPTNGLKGVVAVPLLVGAAPHHSLAVELHLRPLLVELGASCPTRGLYVLEADLERLAQVVAQWLAGAGPALDAALSRDAARSRSRAPVPSLAEEKAGGGAS